jgi:hypothetical protein
MSIMHSKNDLITTYFQGPMHYDYITKHCNHLEKVNSGLEQQYVVQISRYQELEQRFVAQVARYQELEQQLKTQVSCYQDLRKTYIAQCTDTSQSHTMRVDAKTPRRLPVIDSMTRTQRRRYLRKQATQTKQTNQAVECIDRAGPDVHEIHEEPMYYQSPQNNTAERHEPMYYQSPQNNTAERHEPMHYQSCQKISDQKISDQYSDQYSSDQYSDDIGEIGWMDQKFTEEEEAAEDERWASHKFWYHD